MLHSLTGYTSIGSSSGVSASASEDLRGPVRPPPDELVPDVPVPAREREVECEREVVRNRAREGEGKRDFIHLVSSVCLRNLCSGKWR